MRVGKIGDGEVVTVGGGEVVTVGTGREKKNSLGTQWKWNSWKAVRVKSLSGSFSKAGKVFSFVSLAVLTKRRCDSCRLRVNGKILC